MTAPCAIEYILVTRWRGGKKGGQNRVCACDTRDRGVNKKLKPEHPSETVVMPESGERKRNLTTLVLVKNAAVKRSRSRQKVSESSQNPLSSSRRRERARQGRSNVQRSSNDDLRRGTASPFWLSQNLTMKALANQTTHYNVKKDCESWKQTKPPKENEKPYNSTLFPIPEVLRYHTTT